MSTQKIRIRLPATITNLGPALGGVGLALAMYTSVEISRRDDNRIEVEINGEGRDRFRSPLHHPVALGLARYFQDMEQAVAGINVRVNNQIPMRGGLGAEAIHMMAGLLGANDMMGNPRDRAAMLDLTARVTRVDHAVTALYGGVTASARDGRRVLHRAIPTARFSVVVVMPELEEYAPPPMPERVLASDALHNLSRIPLLLEALRDGDLDLLARMLEDRLRNPLLAARITGYEHVISRARAAGAAAVTISGDGPALIAFADERHDAIADEMRLAFQASNVAARTWVVPVDTQGVVISAMQSAV